MERLKTVNRKIWAIVLSIAILLSLLVGIGMAFDVKAAVFEGGDGSIDKPFLISDAEGLNQIQQNARISLSLKTKALLLSMRKAM